MAGRERMVDASHVVLVDDDADLRAFLKGALEHEGHVVTEAGSGILGMHLVDTEPPDLVLLDVGLPDVSGFDVLRHVRRAQPRTGVILLTHR